MTRGVVVAVVTWGEVAEKGRAVAARARLAAGEMDERRAALSRSALVWWQGEAAEGYQRRVQERVGSLAALAARLEALARVADELAAGADAREAAEQAERAAGGRS